jgi:2-polyprenyl-3-methyl-5-hydroxy-6-metoxy-1,4-benzoquinol methylase
MLMMLLNWRVVVLTNPRNFSSPIYGRALRYAGFIEVDGDYNYMLEQVKKQTDEGYSVVIFPEGHRSEGNKLKRFHKGAFQLASALNLDILPIIIYGQKEALKKSEFFLKRAKLITKFLPRIRVNDSAFGENPKDQAKNIKKYFENEYNEVARSLETPNYYSNFIKKNFIYKGPVLEWYTRIKINFEDDYNLFNDLIPNTSVVSDLGCGYGYLSILLGLMSNERIITGVDYDSDKIATASNCAVKSDNVTFISADITNLVIHKSDVFVLNDVLHYLPADKQEQIIDSCINSLNENGMIIIRDADKNMTSRHIGTIITEFFSTGLGFNKSNNKLEFTSKAKIEKIVAQRNMEMEVIDNTKRTSNVIYIIKSQRN